MVEINEKDASVSSLFKQKLDELGIGYEAVYLFGSRARGTSRKDSDYDFFIVLNNDIPPAERSKLFAAISEKIHKTIPHTSFDIKIRNKNDFEKYHRQINYIDNTIYEEGIKL